MQNIAVNLNLVAKKCSLFLGFIIKFAIINNLNHINVKNLRKLSRNDLKEMVGGDITCRGGVNCTEPDGGGNNGCKQCVNCTYPGVGTFKQCYTDPGGDCAVALRQAQALC